ncbi:metallo-beta-lactamase superfamily protein,putative mRNA degradation ribonucleases J1/J2 [Streptococcus pyogenes]|uniref:ribonuclease J1 n=1 Tax=Streptococcus pyogenes TaxID=1314 RepID=UPI00109B7CED|nr:ribonuclease J1 [Streptococcus pyogenes]VGQ22688.1 metallo-beta-lactamase superfamily protein,putative mRNA degradation ribonucleases J1/J2 [Streptococcus pyogenes]VGQ46461.1 metallo-beta-lactamase superfamily protein,putative mRNA degradation ribonucleases J1/J2 [Streptococcus pyogenes]VGV41205.1 metallo-beta-lactamase superfamily protein,putative mRNA degradation ribonucleases J1/J2 [Streptococcus pyogenes]VGV96587.1 metallo-beta-lactamase superfamily protein,putative mRNA degradation ribo
MTNISLKPNEVGVFAIGGLGEIGKNTYGIEYQDEIIIVDAGIKFPEDDLLGIDYVIPDYSYIVDNLDRVKALVITHGHEDHIGGIPFLLKQANIPIYAGPLALALIRGKLEEHGLWREATVYEINHNTELTFKNMSVTFFKTTHSIPEPVGIVIHTPQGKIICTGDFKFDFTPVGDPADLQRMAALGEEGVLCLLSDSTNAEIPTFTNSEKVVGQSILKIIEGIHGRIIFASFASNIYRLQQAAEAAVKTGRKIAVFGRSMEKAIVNGIELGYIKVPKDTFIEPSELKNLHASEVLIMCTGSQGESMAALARIANGTHRQVTLQPGDTVIFSSSPIPGNTTSVNKLINTIQEAGVDVIHGKVNNIHTSGHGGQQEQKLMLSLIKPKYFMPVHGEYRMQKVHAGLAMDIGIPKENIFIMENGDVLALTSDSARIAGHFNAQDIYVDGNGIGDIGAAVLRDRRDLSEDGVVLAVATVDFNTQMILAGPDILSRGFIYMRESGDLIRESQRVLFNAIRIALKNKDASIQSVNGAIVNALRPFLYEKTEREPIIIPMVLTPDKR